MKFAADDLVGTQEGLDYVRGYFDAEGGMPKDSEARLYLSFGQKDRMSLETVAKILSSWGIESGRIHNPSVSVDPDYWRVFVRASSHQRFMRLVGSWHPRKQALIQTRMKIWSTPYGDVGTNVKPVLRPLAGDSERQKFGYLLETPLNPTVRTEAIGNRSSRT